ncbi:MAG: PorV/PorQ family protein [Calditrichaeota bacterium]|nr:PorV/PorQ family protein [Calditrichota bacterium]MCB9391313.1 PorV/PorQ family protein [Calditrichota bacterium]
MKRWRILGVLLICLMAPSFVWAQAKVGTAGVQFLKISPSVRAVGMGEAFVAVANDANAIWHNPGALARLERPQGAISWIDYVAGLQYGYLGLTQPVERFNGAVAVSMSYLTTDEIKETTPDRPDGTGRTFTAGDFAGGISYSQMLTDKFSVGGTLKIVSEMLADKSATGWAADIGTFYDTGWKSVRIAMLTSNFGPDMKFVEEEFPLPMNFTFGASMYAINTNDRDYWNGQDSLGTHALLVSLAWSHPNDNLEVYNLGLEYGFHNTVFLRAGKKLNGWTRKSWDEYRTTVNAGEDASADNPYYEYPLFSRNGTFIGNGASLGAGLNLEKAGLTMDYAYTGISFLGDIHRFSLGYRFNKRFL